MKRNNNHIILLIISVILLAVYFTLLNRQKKESRYNWHKTYKDGLREPYDFGVFKNLIKNKAGTGFVEINKNLGKELGMASSDEKHTMVYIGGYAYLTKSEIDSIFNFVADGNQVVLISESFPDTMLASLCEFGQPLSLGRFDHSHVSVESYNVNSKIKDYKFEYRGMISEYSNTDWYYLNEDQSSFYDFAESDKTYLKLNSINGKLNYAKFDIGAGSIYLHTTPILFTNYALDTETGFKYVDEIFSEIEMENVLYDISSREPKTDYESIQRRSDSPLSYILKQRSLKWAWYSFLVMIVLFFLFRAKRKQRIVPLLEKKRNSSIGFIETLSGLFYKKSNHKEMAETKMHSFLYFIRHKLHISTSDIQADTITLISAKTSVPEREIEDIFNYYNYIIKTEQGDLDAVHLLELHNHITRFYQSYRNKINQQ